VGVRVHEAGEEVHPGGVDLPGGALWPSLRIDRDLGVADGGDRGDPVVLDDDVGRPEGRGAGAIDDGDAPDDQLRVGTLAFAGGPVRGVQDGASLGGDGTNGDEPGKERQGERG